MEKFLRLGLLVLCLVMIAALYFFVAPHLSFATLKDYAQRLQGFVDRKYGAAVILYVCAYVVDGAFALPFSVLLTLAGGFLFGIWYGTLFAVIGATMGATLCFLMVRYLVGDFVAKRYAKQFAALSQELEKRGVYYLLSLRFLALVPFTFVNIIAGLLPISLQTFVITTLIGILPGAFVFAYAGQSLATIASPKDILSPHIVIAFILLALLALIPVLIRRRSMHIT